MKILLPLGFIISSTSLMACPNLSGKYSCKSLKPAANSQTPLQLIQTHPTLELKSELFADGTMNYDLQGKPTSKSFLTPFKKKIVIESKTQCDPLILKTTESIDDQIHLTHIQRELFKEKGKLYIFSKYIVAGTLSDTTLYECVIK